MLMLQQTTFNNQVQGTAAVTQPVVFVGAKPNAMTSDMKALGSRFIFKRISPEEIERVIKTVNANESHLKISSLLSMYEFPTENPGCP